MYEKRFKKWPRFLPLTISHLLRGDVEQFDDGLLPGKLHVDSSSLAVAFITGQTRCRNLEKCATRQHSRRQTCAPTQQLS